jgi:hypothetical protein
MKPIICRQAIKTGGKYASPGSIVNVEDDEAARLVRLGAAEFISSTPATAPATAPTETGEADDGDDGSIDREEAIAELAQIKGVNDKWATDMFEAGITGIGMLQDMSPDALNDLPIKGIGAKKAADIIADAKEFQMGD